MGKLDITKLLVRNSCPICGGNYKVRDNVKTINDAAFEVLVLKECVNCGHWWIDPLATQDYLKELYNKGSAYVQDLDFNKDKLINKKILYL